MAFDREIVEAELALGAIHPEDMPGVAVDALEAGVDGPSIRRLAGLTKPSRWETDQILPAFRDETGLRNISCSEACLRLGRQLAKRILIEGRDPLDYTREFETLWVRADYPSDFQRLGTLDDEKYVSGCMGRSDDDFREYMRGLLLDLAGRGKDE